MSSINPKVEVSPVFGFSSKYTECYYYELEERLVIFRSIIREHYCFPVFYNNTGDKLQ